jgi:HEAT repeat protein
MSVERVLNHISDEDGPLSPSMLHMLSALTREEMELFTDRWPLISAGRRRQVTRALVEITEDNFTADFHNIFRLGLQDEDEEVRARAIQGLWEDESPAFVDSLLEMLSTDPSIMVRAGAAMGLGHFVLLTELEELEEELGHRIVRALWKVIEDPHEALDVRRRAVEAISFSGEEGIREIIHEAYHHPVEKMRISAIFSMGRSADPDWGPIVITELGSPNPEIRFECARACGELELKEAVPSLIRLIVDLDREVQQAAIYALGQIGGQEARRALELCCESDDEVIAATADEALDELTFASGIFDMPLWKQEEEG